MKNKRLFIIILILIILIIIMLIILSKVNKKEEMEKYIEEENPILQTNIKIEELKDETEFFTVQECINTYFQALDNGETDKVYNMLNKEYVKRENISKTNILENGFEYFFVNQIYFKEISYGVEYQYYVLGELVDDNYSSKQTLYIVVNMDFKNKTFSITIPQKTRVNEKEYLQIIDNLSKSNSDEFIDVESQEITQIEKNKDNTFSTNNTIMQYMLNYYMKHYSINAVYYPEVAYSMLNEEYKNKRFGTLEEYKDYIEENKFKILNYTIKEYNITEKEDYTEYVVIDTNNNYYIFRITDIMKYSIILDFYTMDIEQITSKYDESTEQEKVAINIQKIVSAINSKDYKYMYEKLNDTFKNNKFGTFENFEQYAENTFIGTLKLNFREFTNEGETYIYNINLSGTTASNPTKINMQIIMQLLENRDFVMSFNIE